MILHFYLRYSTDFGQSIYVSGNHQLLGDGDIAEAFPLQYLNDQLWHGFIEVDIKEINCPIQYRYILRQDSAAEIEEFGNDRIVDVEHIRAEKITLMDTWNYSGEPENIYYSKPFREVFLQKPIGDLMVEKPVRNYTHEFRVKAPLLGKNETICISGSAKIFKNWNKETAVPLIKSGDWYIVRLNFSKEIFPVSYKYGVYNSSGGGFVKFEEGNNRILLTEPAKGTKTILHDGFADIRNQPWKGAGVSIPVFSLRRKNGFGTGEFTDIKLLVDWAKQSGLKLIQLLPVNDTTNTHLDKDSYPYSAISAFALHPLYLNVDELEKGEVRKRKGVTEKIRKKLDGNEVLDYEEVMRVKQAAIHEVYRFQRDEFLSDLSFFSFFDVNRHWLVPYAAFSFLRDKYGTADFAAWNSNSVYQESEIQELVDPENAHYNDILVYYFVQFHLHKQLKEAADYAHAAGIILKGDIPIGVCRHSVEAWMYPDLFNVDEQTGAPPDAFTGIGQNWGFPTYNWVKMKEDDFAWWRKRFEQMSIYFDAFRVDHILGFFRIWSIPVDQVEGVMGRFVPVKPVMINEFFQKGISFDLHRFTKPLVNDRILRNLFGKRTAGIRKVFFTKNEFKKSLNTQRKIEDYFSKQETPDPDLKKLLFGLLSNVILFEEKESHGQEFHFRIGMEQTSSFENLDAHSKKGLKELYIDYFFHRQDELWRKEALKKLPELKRSTDMMVCGEDLGMVPHCVPELMKQLGILSLEIQRMPKMQDMEFFHPRNAPYLSVVTPSTHDMSTIRGWWEEDMEITKRFYHQILLQAGIPPAYCEPEINKEIVLQHLYSPAMWAIFQLQDILGINAVLRRKDPAMERINDPANPNHVWNYRIHINLEDLISNTAFNVELKNYIAASGR